MALKHELFELVKSMSRGEKRAFSLLAARYQGDKDNYLYTLLKKISKQKEYNEESLKEYLKNVGIKSSWPTVKHKLLELLYTSLRWKYEQDYALLRTNRELDVSELLVERSLEAASEQRIQRLMQNHIQMEQYEAWLATFPLWRKVIWRRYSLQEYTQHIAAAMQKAKEIRRIINNKWEVYEAHSAYLNDLFYQKEKQPQIQAPEGVLANPENGLCKEARYLIYSANLIYCAENQEYSKAFDHAIAQINLFEQLNKKDTLEVGLWASAYHNAMLVLLYWPSAEKRDMLLERMQKATRSIPHIPTRQDMCVRILGLQFKLALYEQDFAQVWRIGRRLSRNEGFLNRPYFRMFRLTIFWEMARWSLFRKEIEAAEEWIDLIKKDREDLKYNIEQQGLTRLLELFVLWEKQDYERIVMRVIAIRQFFRTYKLMDEYVDLFLSNMRLLAVKPKNSEKILKQWLLALEEVESSTLERMHELNLPLWIQGRLDKQSVWEVMHAAI